MPSGLVFTGRCDDVASFSLSSGQLAIQNLIFDFSLLQMLRKKKTSHSSNPPQEAHIGWVMDSREHRPRSASIRCADAETLCCLL